MEELKVIMEALSGLGTDAKAAFIVWVVAKYVLHYLTTTVLVGGLIFTLYKIALKIFNEIGFTAQIKDVMGFYGDMYGSKKQEVLKILMDHKNKKDK